MKKSIAHILSFVLLSIIIACGTSSTDNAKMSVEDSLKNANLNLSNQVADKDSAIFGFIKSYNEIQENLLRNLVNTLKEKPFLESLSICWIVLKI